MLLSHLKKDWPRTNYNRFRYLLCVAASRSCCTVQLKSSISKTWWHIMLLPVEDPFKRGLKERKKRSIELRKEFSALRIVFSHIFCNIQERSFFLRKNFIFYFYWTLIQKCTDTYESSYNVLSLSGLLLKSFTFLFFLFFFFFLYFSFFFFFLFPLAKVFDVLRLFYVYCPLHIRVVT